MRLIYHLVSRSRWLESADPYRADSLADEGFIHCSNEDQVARVANLFYGGQEDLVVLVIDVGRLASPVRNEEVGGESFPHVHGPIERAAVQEVRPLQRGPDGRWVFP